MAGLEESSDDCFGLVRRALGGGRFLIVRQLWESVFPLSILPPHVFGQPLSELNLRCCLGIIICLTQDVSRDNCGRTRVQKEWAAVALHTNVDNLVHGRL